MLPDQEKVQMVARNSGTGPAARPGSGLRALGDKLRPFGGSLTGQVFRDWAGGWTFAVTVTLPVWQGG